MIRRLTFAVLALLAVALLSPETWERVGVRGQERPALTFTRDIAPIIFEQCAPCHRPDEIAPFSLLTYDDVRRRAEQIVQVTARRYMPPWKPVPGYGGPFLGERRLSDEQIETIAQWVEHGSPEGDPADLPAAPERSQTWHFGTPDLVITMPESYTLRADGPDVFRNFVIPIPITEPKYVAGLEFRPGNTRVAHHANLRIDRTPSSRELDAEDPLPGYEGPISPNADFPDGHFLGWTPGQLPPLAAKGMAWRLDPGSDVVIQLHMQTSGKPEPVQARVGLYFTDDPPVRAPMMVRLGRQNIDIAPGTEHYVITDSYRLPVDVEVYGVQPHAHFRAKEIKGRARLPDGDVRWLIYIDDWDFGWQDVYRYVDPIALPAGTTVEMEYTYDNSADNVRNPDRPPRRVLWGQNSTDEMGDLWLQVLTRTPGDRASLFSDFRPKVLREDVSGYETMLLADPGNAGLHADAALISWALGQGDRAVAHYEEAVRLRPDDPKTRYNLGTLLIETGRLEDGLAQLRRAVELRPGHAGTHTNLGAVLRSLGQLDNAVEHFRRALAIEPTSAAAHSNLGFSLVSRGDVDEGSRYLREAIARDTNFAEPHYHLANVLAAQGDLEGAIEHHQHARRIAPDWAEPMSGLAWIWATTSDPALLRPDDAVRLAERASALTKRQHVGVLDTLAAAYAAAGRFDDAVSTAEEAIRLAVAVGREPVPEQLRRRAGLYRNRQPYRDR